MLAVVVFLTGCFGYYQESKSSDIMEAFATLKPKNVTVVRGGKPMSIEPRDLVPGDVIELEQGMKVPADIRIIQCTPDMKVCHHVVSSSLPTAFFQPLFWLKGISLCSIVFNLYDVTGGSEFPLYLLGFQKSTSFHQVFKPINPIFDFFR